MIAAPRSVEVRDVLSEVLDVVVGQQYAYVKKQLADFKAKRRTNDAGNMTSVAGTLSDDDIENLAQYIANLN